MNIKHVMRHLPPETMKEIMVHFNSEEAYQVDYDETLVLCVNVVPEHYPHLRFIEVAGVWSLAEKL